MKFTLIKLPSARLIVLFAALAMPSEVFSEDDPIILPNLNFKPTKSDERNFEKYYYFHRADTDLDTATADIRFCDSYARGLNPQTGAPAVGGMAVAGLAAAINSANRRGLRRINMRRCMFFKGYERYGLPKAVWVQFNFEEGANTVDEAQRSAMLAAQAKAASGPKPLNKGLGE